MRRNGRGFPLVVSAAWALVAGCGTSAGHAGFGADRGGEDASAGSGSGGPGGAPGSAGSSGSSGAPGGATSTGGGSGGMTASSGAGSTGGGAVLAGDGGACTLGASNVRVTEIDVGAAIAYNEVDANGAQPGLEPLVIAPVPAGGSRLSWMGSDGMLHVARLDANDQLVAGSAFTMPAFDYEDLWADDTGGVALVTRAALGGSAADHNCGNINNLCGLVANYPTADPCMDMYLVRFDGTAETWAAKLTDTSATLPAYDTGPTSTTNVVFVWWYAHNGRIAFDGANYGAYFGAAISTSQPCVGQSTMATGINIHQGDRLKVVSSAGAVQSGGFSFGCSHSAFERLIWDPNAKTFVAICENDAPTGGKSGRIAIAPRSTTIYAADLSYSNLGSLLADPAGGYWAITSDIRAGQPAGMDGLADVLLLHFTTGAADAPPVTVASDPALNDRAPHLAAFGAKRMLAAWETSTRAGDFQRGDPGRKLYLQVLDASTGAPEGTPYNVPAVVGSRYQDFRTYPDGSVAYPAPGSAGTKIRILRVLPCP